MSKRQAERKEKKGKEIKMEILALFVENLLKSIQKGYEERLNRYLHTCSKEMLQEIGYTEIRLKLIQKWEPVSEEEKELIFKAREIQLKNKAEILKSSFVRSHYREGVKTSSHVIWGSAGYQTPDLPTKKEIEIAVLNSLIGYLAEKGIEYSEAERNVHNTSNFKQSSTQTEEGETVKYKTAKKTTD